MIPSQVSRDELRSMTLAHSLFTPVTIREAIDRLQFVQIDPIIAPAPSQDLILRHRIVDYRAGDIDRQYSLLDLEEDFLYAHGYMTRRLWNLLHPREKIELTAFDTEVLALVRDLPEVLPHSLDTHFSGQREVNWWGGYSRASRMALERLHYYGFIRVKRRDKGQRVYQAFDTAPHHITLEQRIQDLIVTIVNCMAPVAVTTLSQSLHRVNRLFAPTRPFLKQLLEEGILIQKECEGVSYVWPSSLPISPFSSSKVYFLAPFDPVVRDRIRFNHLWGWNYQFEAYIPASKRVRGYYALPILYNNSMIGWVNLKVVNNSLQVVPGYVSTPPTDSHYSDSFSTEVDQLRRFLNIN